jgi:archaellum component FlaG (FlaF/FlaG flagellin family)
MIRLFSIACRYMLFVIVLTFVCGCKQPHKAQAKNMNMDAIEFEIVVTPSKFNLADIGKVQIAMQVLNTGAEIIDADAHLFDLQVNGEPSMVWSLSGNGIREAKWSALPPGESVSRTWDSLAAGLFPAIGIYKLQLSWNGKMAPLVTVEVE